MRTKPFLWLVQPIATLAFTLALDAPGWVVMLAGVFVIAAATTETVRWRQERGAPHAESG